MSLLPEPNSAMLMHDCAEIIDEVYSSRIDLQDQPLEEADCTLYADGNSDMDTGNRKAGDALETLEGIAEAEAQPMGTSAQKAEWIALTGALEFLRKKRVCIPSQGTLS